MPNLTSCYNQRRTWNTVWEIMLHAKKTKLQQAGVFFHHFFCLTGMEVCLAVHTVEHCADIWLVVHSVFRHTKQNFTLHWGQTEVRNMPGCVPTLSNRWVRHGWRDMDSLHRLKGSTFRDWLQQRGLKGVFLRSWMLPSDTSSRVLYHFLTSHLMKQNIYLHVSELHCKHVGTMPHT